MLLEYFGERWATANCGKCDNCCCSDAQETFDLTEEARNFAFAVFETGERFGMGVPVGVLKGSRSKLVTSKSFLFREPSLDSMKSFGQLKSKSPQYLKALGRLLIHHNVLQSYYQHKFLLIKLGPTGLRLIQEPDFRMERCVLSEELSKEVVNRHFSTLQYPPFQSRRGWSCPRRKKWFWHLYKIFGDRKPRFEMQQGIDVLVIC